MALPLKQGLVQLLSAGQKFSTLGPRIISDICRPLLCSNDPHLGLYRCVSFNVQDADDFQDRVLDSKTPVIVDFHATWCGPCKLLGPRLEKLISEHEGNVSLAKVDIDDNEEIAFKFKVQAVPTVVAMKDGKEIDRFVGMKEKDEIQSFIKKIV